MKPAPASEPMDRPAEMRHLDAPMIPAEDMRTGEPQVTAADTSPYFQRNPNVQDSLTPADS